MKTLDEFIEEALQRNLGAKPFFLSSNAYVREPGFDELYVRLNRRYLGDKAYDHVLDIARVEASEPGKGAFTRLADHLLGRGFPVFVECVHNARFVEKLKRDGWVYVEQGPSFYKLPV